MVRISMEATVHSGVIEVLSEVVSMRKKLGT